MAAVRFLTGVVGERFDYAPGQVVEMPGDEARKWCDGVRAELVRTPTTETTTASPSHRVRTRRP